MTEHAVPRTTGRVIVVDSRDCVLLFGCRDPGGEYERLWVTPGGRLNDGESTRDAAARELGEETGLVVDSTELGAPVAYAQGLRNSSDGVLYRAHDEYWVIRVPALKPDTSKMEKAERDELIEPRWWSLAELTAIPTTEVVYPIGLGELVSRLLAAGAPTEAIRLPYSHPRRAHSSD